MSNNDFIDLSLMKNQNKLAVKISNFFTAEELLYINLSNLEKANRDINEIDYLYYHKKFDGTNNEIKLIDTLILDTYPALRYVTIRLYVKEFEQTDFRCKYNKNILKQLNLVFAKACNYKHWKSVEDNSIIRNHILTNFSKKITEYIDEEILEETKFVINYLISDGSIKNNNNFYYDFSINKIDFHVESNSLGIVKFGFKREKDFYYNIIQFQKTDTGISYIIFVLQQAEKLLKK